MKITFINIILIIIYFILTIFVWKFWTKKNSNSYPQKYELIILFPTLIIHTLSICYVSIYNGSIILNFSYAFNLTIWLTILMYWIGSFYYNLKGLQIILFPLAIIALTICIFSPNSYQINYNYPILIHISMSIIANSLFGIATIFAILFITLDKDLKKNKLSPIIKFLPPLLSLEKISFQSTIAGFLILTTTLISGNISYKFLKETFYWNNKTIFASLAWIIYFILILGKIFFSWRGKKLSWGIIIGFICLFFAFITSYFIF